MDIYQLKYFKTIARYMNVTKAANALNITQSALSRSLSALEAELGMPLFERTGNKIILNASGEYFLKKVSALLTDLDRTVSETKAMAGIDAGHIHLAISETVFLKQIIFHFLLDNPNMHFKCQILSDDQIKDCLEQGLIDFAVTRRPIIAKDLEWEQVFVDHMMVVFPNGHKFDKRNRISLTELSEEKFIISNIGYNMKSDIIAMCQQAGFEPDILYEGNGEDLTGMLLHAGLGIMLAPYSIAMGIQELHLPQGEHGIDYGIPLTDDFAKLSLGILTKRNHTYSASAQAFYDGMQKYYSELRDRLQHTP